MTPTVFIQFLSKLAAAPELMVFFHLRPLSTPSVPIESRYTVSRTSIPNCYRIVVRHGYTDEVVTHDLCALVHEQLRNFIIREHADRPVPNTGLTLPADEKLAASGSSTSSSSVHAEHRDSDLVGARLAAIQKAYDTQILYIVGKEQLRIRDMTRVWRRVALNAFLWLRDNTRTKIANMKIPTDQLVEVGFIKEV